MRHWPVLLALLAALSGSPLRLSEAAEDLHRALAELAAPAGVEETDGGVGDDSPVTTIRAIGFVGALTLVNDLPVGLPAWLGFRRVGGDASSSPRGHEAAAWSPPAASRRRAALQVYRF